MVTTDKKTFNYVRETVMRGLPGRGAYPSLWVGGRRGRIREDFLEEATLSLDNLASYREVWQLQGAGTTYSKAWENG